jgi:hypothetical protein
MKKVSFSEEKHLNIREIMGISKSSNYELMPRPILIKSVFEHFKNFKDRIERIRGEF